MDQEIPLEALPQYVTQQGNPGNVKGIKDAEVQLPAEFLRRGFHFVDTPGLGSAIEENTRTTESFLPEADAFLLVTSYESPLSDEEVRFFRAAASSPRRIFMVVNKQDTVRDRERADALDYLQQKLDAMFGEALRMGRAFGHLDRPSPLSSISASCHRSLRATDTRRRSRDGWGQALALI